ncbi:HesB/YadR/YfhF family protein [Amphibacillus sp. MSJ-3]|uniref:HesB/YadR/YfhF family protein n=1 Tax=Amphibacillus sp. MSJ-3 TaxID=2841505 RepID=UPI001C0EB165|nr:HesB/YadR/YfhF family protein [Amphibacillus sp. MSJ-3]MBU5595215.1 HesB/YadR/YfhF family protein [Amphibacillus sp. MSJ-3]
MKIVLTDRALKWFKEDYGVKEDEYVKFYPQIYGTSPVQDNFALAFNKVDQPIDKGVIVEIENIRFLVEHDDLWFFDGHDLKVDYLDDEDEVIFDYQK